MRKVLSRVAMIAALALVVGLGVAAFAQGSQSGGSGTVSVSSHDPTSSDEPTPDGDEVKGNCDEAEHANDPECSGAVVDGSQEDDHSGPSENAGPGSADDDDEAEEDDLDEDHSGPSEDSGPGTGDD